MAERVRRARSGERGFTLIEVMVAMVIFALVASAALGALIMASRASVTAKRQTQAKGLVQEQIERMRQMPFHVGATQGSYRDVLDTYFPNATDNAAGSPTYTAADDGYVPASAARLPLEPSGAFYRWVSDRSAAPGWASFEDYRVIVATQFLDAARAVVTPSSGYDTTKADPVGAPATGLVGVTVIAVWQYGGKVSTSTTFSQISDARPGRPLTSSSARAAAVEVVSRTDDTNGLTLSVASVDASTESATGSAGVVNADPGRASWALVEQRATPMTVAVPPDVVTPRAVSDTGTYSILDPATPYPGACLACFGPTAADGGRGTTSFGQPVIGDPATGTPVRSRLLGGTTDTYRGFSFSNQPSDPKLDLANAPLVSVSGPAGSPSLAESSVLLETRRSPSRGVAARTTSQTRLVRIMPTSFAPLGVLQVELSNAWVQCDVNSSTGTPSATGAYDWTATVSSWNPLTGSFAKLHTITKSGVTNDNPLTYDKILVGTDKNGKPRFLSEFVNPVTGISTPTTTVSSDNRRVTVDAPSIVTVVTTATRGSSDPGSEITVRVGSLSCMAEDRR